MSDFYIKSVTAKGSGKNNSTVEFSPGLNIIRGRSNTGKTVVLKCIDYCFGKDEKPFDESLGFTTIEMKLHTAKGEISITRSFGENTFMVITDVPGFNDGKYDLNKSNSKNPRPALSDLLLYCIGIEEEHQIIKNKDFERRRLTWRTFIDILIFKNIERETSVIEPEQATQKTAMLSALLFLLYGKDFTETDAQVDKEIRKAKKNAIEEYVSTKIQSAANRKKELRMKLDLFDGVDVDTAMQDAINDLQRTEAQMTDAAELSSELISKIIELQNRAAECELLQSRYSSLKAQYASDIKRLSFIVDGEAERIHVPQIQNCPFCDGKLSSQNKLAYTDSARAELNRIMSQLKGLEQTEYDLKKEIDEISSRLVELRTKQTEIETSIKKELQPRAEALKQSLNAFQIYTQIKQELQVIDDFASTYTADLRELAEGDELRLEYYPKKHFGEEFQERIDDMLFNALSDCQYENLTTARFNMKDFDIEVNGHKKSEANGKGYCSFLNSIVAVVFRCYLEEYAKYNPGFVVIDTPLLGLDQGIEDGNPESMRTALFDFFIKHQNEGQIIILENMKHLPDTDFEKAGANVITFAKGHSEGRYGFLDGVK